MSLTGGFTMRAAEPLAFAICMAPGMQNLYNRQAVADRDAVKHVGHPVMAYCIVSVTQQFRPW